MVAVLVEQEHLVKVLLAERQHQVLGEEQQVAVVLAVLETQEMEMVHLVEKKVATAELEYHLQSLA